MAMSKSVLKTEIMAAVEAATTGLDPATDGGEKFTEAMWEGVANAVVDHIQSRATVTVSGSTASTCSAGGATGTFSTGTGSIK
jgi:hypothetical protein